MSASLYRINGLLTPFEQPLPIEQAKALEVGATVLWYALGNKHAAGAKKTGDVLAFIPRGQSCKAQLPAEALTRSGQTNTQCFGGKIKNLGHDCLLLKARGQRGNTVYHLVPLERVALIPDLTGEALQAFLEEDLLRSVVEKPLSTIFSGEYLLESGRVSLGVTECSVLKTTAQTVMLEKYSILASCSRFPIGHLEADRFLYIQVDSKSIQILAVARTEAELRKKLTQKAAQLVTELRDVIRVFDADQTPVGEVAA